MKNPKGLSPVQKMAGQFLVAAVFAYYLINYSDVGIEAVIPFTGGKMWNMGVLFLPMFFFIVLGIL